MISSEYIKIRRSLLFERTGDFSLTPILREQAMKEYLYLGQSEMILNEYFELPKWDVNNADKSLTYRLPGNTTIAWKNNSWFLTTYRLIKKG